MPGTVSFDETVSPPAQSSRIPGSVPIRVERREANSKKLDNAAGARLRPRKEVTDAIRRSAAETEHSADRHGPGARSHALAGRLGRSQPGGPEPVDGARASLHTRALQHGC